MNEENVYTLKHKDDNVGILLLDSEQGAVISYKAVNPEIGPYLGHAGISHIKSWWNRRAIPGSRGMLDKILHEAGCSSNYEYLAKNLGLSMTDCYWICPVNMDLKWEDVNLFYRIGRENSIISYHHQSSYDPNASLGGQMEKYWDLTGPDPLLIKTAAAYYGQQAANEELASVIHDMQHSDIPYVKYQTQRRSVDDALQSVCSSFTSAELEFVPALEIIDSEKAPNNISSYDHFSDVCEANGLDREMVRKSLDYQTLTDFLISNTDEHLQNFGILRSSATQRFVMVAPIFDSGNSMFFDEECKQPYSRADLLSRKINAVHKSEELMLKSVKYPNVVDMNSVPGAGDIKEFYVSKGIPENKADIISKNYDLKAVMLDEFIHGKKISLYQERHRHF